LVSHFALKEETMPSMRDPPAREVLLFNTALQLPATQRAVYLTESCGEDAEMFSRIAALLEAHERAGAFLQEPLERLGETSAVLSPRELNTDRRHLGTAGERCGDQVDRYKLLEQIGEGGCGVVYMAEQEEPVRRRVALKVIKLGMDTRQVIARFEAERQALAMMDHPNIAKVFDAGATEAGRPYFVMELVRGVKITDFCDENKVSTKERLQLFTQVCHAIQHAHHKGVIHRDIKPTNILVPVNDGVPMPKVIDFGIAKATQGKLTDQTLFTAFEQFIGTPAYMSPEQAVMTNVEVDTRSDIYSLGVLLYELLTGQTPFAQKNLLSSGLDEMRRTIREKDPVRPSTRLKTMVASDLGTVAKNRGSQPPQLIHLVRGDLDWIVMKCLQKERALRYETANALAMDLERHLNHRPVLAHRTGLFTRGKKWLRRNATAAVAAVSLAGFIAAVGVIAWRSDVFRRGPKAGIAVLPFENLSENNEGGIFADGVQDDILTKLAKISDLKVISRTSVTAYRGVRDVKEIGRSLNVSYVLEGSVRRDAGKIHLNTNLIDARTDQHVWAEEYDRYLNEVFAVQSEVAKKVAEQLHARISPDEKRSIERAPTTDLVAFDLYTRAKTILLSVAFSVANEQNLRQVVELLAQAVQRDPTFFEAYYQLAYAHEELYLLGFDHTHERVDLAEAALQTLARLRPDAAETHLARAHYLYRIHRDYDRSLAELENARRSLPNDPRLFELIGRILRRRGQPEEALRNLQRALELDPRNYFTLQQTAISYQQLRRYPEAAAMLDRVLTIIPNDVVARGARAWIDFDWKADIRPLHQMIEAILAKDPASVSDAADNWFCCALLEHDRAAAERALVALGDNPWWADDTVVLGRDFGEGLLARAMKDNTKAQAAFSKARSEQEKIVQAQPEYGPPLCVLALIDAGLGRKEAALMEGRRAIELLPLKKDSIDGGHMIQYFAVTAAWAGEKDLALQQLQIAIRTRSPSQVLSYGALKSSPFWDPLHGDPRFEKIVDSLAPK
jgi:serine/threonine protein kinase/TolB-like protein/Tfp pilus assembly protein PilF